MTKLSDNADQVLSEVVESGALVGVVAGAWTADGEHYEGASGIARDGVAMATDTVVWIASMTKAVTAAAAMQLVERGAVALDEPLGDLVPHLGTVLRCATGRRWQLTRSCREHLDPAGAEGDL